MKIYVASSWRNPEQPWLREMGYEVYDFRNPKEGDNGFAWKDVGLEPHEKEAKLHRASR